MIEANNFKILLVDDEPDIIEFVGYNLKKEGFQVLTSSNGVEAISIAKKRTSSFNCSGRYDA